MRRLVPAFAALILLATAAPAYAFGSSPDTGYGTNGHVEFAVQSSGLISVQQGPWTYVAYTYWGMAPARPVVQRLDVNGVADPAYGAAGMRTLAPRFGQVDGLAVSTAGDAYVSVDNWLRDGGRWRNGMVHLLPDGSLDRTYGVQGLAQLATDDWNEPYYVDASDDGVVVVAGVHINNINRRHSPSNGYVMRVLPNGTLDHTFSGDGRRSIRGKHSFVSSAWLSGAKTVLVGGSRGQDWVMQLRAHGSLDPTFADNGVLQVETRSGRIQYLSGISTAAGTIVSGFVHNRTTNHTRLLTIHLTADGQYDASFSTDGRSWLDLPDNAYFAGYDAADDGTLAVLGSVPVGKTQSRPFVAAVGPDGQADIGLGTTGWSYIAPRPKKNSSVYAKYYYGLTIAGDGLLVGSDAWTPNGEILRLTKYIPGP